MPNLQGKRWCFTLNNFTPEQVELILSLFDQPITRYGIFGKETGASGTPHLQGFVIFHTNQRFDAVRALLRGAHCEVARGTSIQAREYCKKDGDFTERGSFPDSHGKRNDLAELLEWGDDFIRTSGRAPTQRDVAKHRPRDFLKYPRAIELFQLRAPPPVIQQGELTHWQSELVQELEDPADDRKIIFYVDYEGNNGKSWLQRYMLSHVPGVQLLSIGKRDDIAHTIDTSNRIFLFNVPRDCMQYLQYTVLESLKDKVVFSPKYASTMKIFTSPVHVVVFCNEDVDRSKLSNDRIIERKEFPRTEPN